MFRKPKVGSQQTRFPSFSLCHSKLLPSQSIFYNTLAFLITTDQNISSRKVSVERGHFDELETFNRSMPVVAKKKNKYM